MRGYFPVMAAAVDTAEAVETRVKPARPDEHKFKAELAQAEKEHAAVQEKLVWCEDAEDG